MADPTGTDLPGVDMNRPSAARVYDYFLGGAHNFQVDRELAAQIQRMTPNIAETMRANRGFLRRAVRFMVGEGVRQFLDIGSGIPTVGNVHEVAQAAAPGTRVLYVDIDPVAVAHSEYILRDDPAARVLQGDLRRPAELLAAVRELDFLDFAEPIAVLLAGVVHFVPTSADPAGIVATLCSAVAPGSYLLISHVTYEQQPPEVIEAQKLSGRTGTEIVLRSGAEIQGYLGDFEPVEPGMVFLTAWRPESDTVDAHPEWIGAYAVVGRKPA